MKEILTMYIYLSRKKLKTIFSNQSLTFSFLCLFILFTYPNAVFCTEIILSSILRTYTLISLGGRLYFTPLVNCGIGP